MSSMEDRLQSLKKKEAEARQSYSRLEGRRAQLMQQLTDNFGVDTIEAAQEKLTVLDKDLERREARAERLLAELEALVQ